VSDAVRYPRPSDTRLVGMVFDEDGRHSRFELVPGVARGDGGLYGGAATAASIVALEAATGRGALWVTTQFVATSAQGDVIECEAEVLARGRNVAQAQVTGRTGGRVLFVSLGSTASPRPGGLEGQYVAMPECTPPAESETILFNLGRPDAFLGFSQRVEFRQAVVAPGRSAASPLTMWARLVERTPLTPAAVAFMADMVPAAIVRASGIAGGGISLDNSLRFGAVPEDEEWVLLELSGDMAWGAHAHGSVRVWTVDGSLIAVGGQSVNMMQMTAFEAGERRRAGQQT